MIENLTIRLSNDRVIRDRPENIYSKISISFTCFIMCFPFVRREIVHGSPEDIQDVQDGAQRAQRFKVRVTRGEP